MAAKPLPSPELLRQLLRYEPETGKLFWTNRSPEHFDGRQSTKDSACSAWNEQFSGKEAFTSNSNGYLIGTVKDRGFRAHRVAWAIYYSEWPRSIIDHVNQNKKDNRICNLQLSDHGRNARNAVLSAKNSSGTTGVYWYKALSKWLATIRLNGHNRHLGYFDNKDDAITARKNAQAKHGYSPLHGRKKSAVN